MSRAENSAENRAESLVRNGVKNRAEGCVENDFNNGDECGEANRTEFPSSKCELCPVRCGADRINKLGRCGAADSMRIARYGLHFFEEPVISGTKGSGTIFFCGCSLKCVFCQNYELSRNLRGKDITVAELADIFAKLEKLGAHNINLVSPTQYSDKIIRALNTYRPKIPVVYNTHGYERTEIIEKLFPYVDVFLPDLKFFSPALSERYTGIKDYFEKSFAAVKIMSDKPLVFGDDGMMKSGTIVRHLVLPQCVADSKKVLENFAQIKDKAYVNVMSQYTPFGDIQNFPELQRPVTAREYERVIDYAISLGIEKMYYQKRESTGTQYIPQWDY